MKSLLVVFNQVSRTRYRINPFILLAAVLLWSASFATNLAAKEPPTKTRKAPELTGIAQWINSDGLTVASQKGKVVVLHFWTFGCINCQRNLPFYNQWRKDFAADKVQIVGVHTPESAGEADIKNLATQVQKLEIDYPVAVDNDGATWKAYGNRYWPSVYVIDKQGRIRYGWEGELEYQDAGGDRKLRAIIKKLSEDKD